MIEKSASSCYYRSYSHSLCVHCRPITSLYGGSLGEKTLSTLCLYLNLDSFLSLTRSVQIFCNIIINRETPRGSVEIFNVCIYYIQQRGNIVCQQCGSVVQLHISRQHKVAVGSITRSFSNNTNDVADKTLKTVLTLSILYMTVSITTPRTNTINSLRRLNIMQYGKPNTSQIKRIAEKYFSIVFFGHMLTVLFQWWFSDETDEI